MRRTHSGSYGFTLVELMVAVTGGLFVSLAVFVLAKHSTGFYQSEARAGNATFGGIIGFNRLKADISRAGFLASPNVRRDPSICGTPATGWPTQLSNLQSVSIVETATANVPTILANNGRQPDVLTLAGSYASIDQFETSGIYNSGSNDIVQLRNNSPGMARLGYLDTGITAAQQTARLQEVFQAGRALRVVDKSGREQYGTISSVTGGGQPQITLVANSPALQYRDGNALRCGVNDLGVGSIANVVNFIQYAVRAPTTGNTDFDPAINDPNAAPTDTGRTELIRAELDTSGNLISGTEEVVTEYAVDLKFGITVASAIGTASNGAPNQTALTTFSPGSTNIPLWADPAQTSLPNGPQLIRSVRARLSVRSREADRIADVPTGSDAGPSSPVAPGFYRIRLSGGGSTPYARVRTMQADIALRNQMGVMWQ